MASVSCRTKATTTNCVSILDEDMDTECRRHNDKLHCGSAVRKSSNRPRLAIDMPRRFRRVKFPGFPPSCFSGQK
eukprot:IDg12745t1